MTTASVIKSLAETLNGIGLPVDYNRRYVQAEVPFLAVTLERTAYGLEVRYLWVRPDARGDGLGKAIMQTICEWADRTGTRIRLWTKPFACRDRSPYSLVPFYAQFGFQPQFLMRRKGWHTRVRMHRG